MASEVVTQHGKFFVKQSEGHLSGPWSTRAAAEAASDGNYTRANILEAKQNSQTKRANFIRRNMLGDF